MFVSFYLFIYLPILFILIMVYQIVLKSKTASKKIIVISDLLLQREEVNSLLICPGRKKSHKSFF